jgi:UDPglucose 6-dehydrogenase
MKNGEVPIYEPHLDVLFERNIKQGRLSFTTDLNEAVESAQVVFLALPTPPGEDGSADLSYVLGVADNLGKIMKDYKVLVDKSTVPVGTADKVTAAVKKHATVDFDVVSNPEFLREGFAVDDFLKPDRVVVGTSSARAQKIMEELYKPYVRQGNPIIFMDEKSAELTKYAANAFLATKITFMNEVANLCELLDADVDKVRIGIGTDTRIGKRFLFPGIGYGGSCFPKDVQALAKSAAGVNYDFALLTSVMEVNEKQKTIIVPKIKDFFGGDLKGKHFALWGLAFKPDTDDIREAPALYVIDKLLAAGATITAYDPEAIENVRELLGDKISYADDQYKALAGADALIIATEWSVFRSPEFDKLKTGLKEKVIFDGRNLYDLDQMKNLGFYYNSIGRKTVIPQG